MYFSAFGWIRLKAVVWFIWGIKMKKTITVEGITFDASSNIA
jgi:hypothetical protein